MSRQGPPGLRLWPVSAGLKVTCRGPTPDLAPDLARRVDEIWARGLERSGGALFDGLILSLAEHSPARLVTHLAPYRRFWASRQDPDLPPALAIRPLAVSGLVWSGGRMIWGRRGREVTQEAGSWELAPSGGLSGESLGQDGRVDFAGQLLAEAREELGIQARELSAPQPLVLVEDLDSQVWDLGLECACALDPDEVLARHQAQGSSEYGSLSLVVPEKLTSFLAAHRHGVVAVSLALCQARGLPAGLGPDNSKHKDARA